jgi:hypothetical protein
LPDAAAQLQAALGERGGAAVDLLAELVEIESHVSLPDGVRAVGSAVARELGAAGFDCEWRLCEPVTHEPWIAELLLGDTPPERVAPALVAERPGRGGRVLLLGDLDTAHAPGSLARNRSGCRAPARSARASRI